MYFRLYYHLAVCYKSIWQRLLLVQIAALILVIAVMHNRIHSSENNAPKDWCWRHPAHTQIAGCRCEISPQMFSCIISTGLNYIFHLIKDSTWNDLFHTPKVTCLLRGFQVRWLQWFIMKPSRCTTLSCPAALLPQFQLGQHEQKKTLWCRF